MKKLTLAALAALAVGAVLLLGGCSSVSTEIDQVALHYTGGPIQDKHYADFVPPGVSGRLGGFGDKYYIYPYGQRTYTFARTNAEAPPLSIVSRDNVTLTVTGQVLFTLNTNPEVLRQFHERIGMKYKAWEPEGWRRMLADYVLIHVDRALDGTAQRYGWKAIYNDPAVRNAFEKDAAAEAVRRVREATGGEYFCSPTYTGTGPCGDMVITIQKPEPPAKLVEALAAEQAAILQNEAQKKINQKVATEMESIRQLVAVLGPNGAVMWKAIQDGKITVVPVPQGGSIQISPRQ